MAFLLFAVHILQLLVALIMTSSLLALLVHYLTHPQPPPLIQQVINFLKLTQMKHMQISSTQYQPESPVSTNKTTTVVQSLLKGMQLYREKPSKDRSRRFAHAKFLLTRRACCRTQRQMSRFLGYLPYGQNCQICQSISLGSTPLHT